MKATNKDGSRNAALIKKVVKLRDTDNLSWTKIKLAIREGKTGVTVSGSTVRRMYDEGHGRKGAHYESRPLTGGRYRKGTEAPKPAEKTTAPKATVKKSARKGSDVSSKVTTVTRTQRKDGLKPSQSALGGRKTPANKGTSGTARKATRKSTTATPASDSSERPAEQVG